MMRHDPATTTGLLTGPRSGRAANRSAALDCASRVHGPPWTRGAIAAALALGVALGSSACGGSTAAGAGDIGAGGEDTTTPDGAVHGDTTVPGDASGDAAAPSDASGTPGDGGPVGPGGEDAASSSDADGVMGAGDALAADTGPADPAHGDSWSSDAATGDGGADDAADRIADGPDVPPLVEADPCSPEAAARAFTVTVPLGETLFLRGDDYFPFWGPALSCDAEVTGVPAEATAAVVTSAAGEPRLTPDLAGVWTLTRGADVVTVTVDPDYLTPDTFLNYNYTPVAPIWSDGDGPDGDATLWIASPVSNAVQVVQVTAAGAETGALIPTGSWPTSVAAWTDSSSGTGYLLVSQSGRDTLGFLDRALGRVTDAIHVGNEPAGIVVLGDEAWVAISGSNQVARVHLGAREVMGWIDVGRDPRSLAYDPDTGLLFVSSLVSSNAHAQGPDSDLLPASEQPDVAVIDTATGATIGWSHAVATHIRGLWVRPDRAEVVAAVSHSDNLPLAVDAETRPHRYGLAILDADPQSGSPFQVTANVDLDDQPSSSGPAPSPFTMALTPAADRLLVTLSAGQALLVLDPSTYEELARIPSGSDPRGLAFAGGRVWTYAWLDNQVQGWTIPGAAGGADSGSEMVWAPVGDDPTPLEVKQGQRMFNDAAFSKYGDFSCNNCHPDGLMDGLTWNLLTDGSVNTLAFRNVGGTSPFLWGGQLPTLFDFSREVLKLVGAEASGAQMQLLTIYMQSVTAPPNPYTLPGGRLTDEAKAGQQLFQTSVKKGGAGCTDCHSGPLLTNRTQVFGKTPDLLTDVPSLFGVYDTGPWGRKGQWTSLIEMVEYAVGFTGADLTPSQVTELWEYVRQQPADALYLTSATPLNHSHHVHPETSVELVFSGVLAAGQAGKFSMFSAVAPDAPADTPVAGQWMQSGRAIRFVPDTAFDQNTSYRVAVATPLEGAFGQVTTGEIEITFNTGGDPLTDVSGTWDAQACEPNIGCTSLAAALLQSVGGQVTGVILDNFKEGSLDHLEGVVDGWVLVLDPFTIQSIIGPIFVETGVVLDLIDSDDDGWADTGTGEIPFEFSGTTYWVSFTFTRTGFPDDVEQP